MHVVMYEKDAREWDVKTLWETWKMRKYVKDVRYVSKARSSGVEGEVRRHPLNS